MKKIIATVIQMRRKKKRSKRENLLQNKKRKNKIYKIIQGNGQTKREKTLKNIQNKQIFLKKSIRNCKHKR